jgi:hypothetical protein
LLIFPAAIYEANRLALSLNSSNTTLANCTSGYSFNSATMYLCSSGWQTTACSESSSSGKRLICRSFELWAASLIGDVPTFVGFIVGSLLSCALVAWICFCLIPKIQVKKNKMQNPQDHQHDLELDVKHDDLVRIVVHENQSMKI